MKVEKDKFWQVVRGLCMICVITRHTPKAADYAMSSFPHVAWMLLEALNSFGVAVFVFLSGYFVNIERCKNDTITYLKNRGGAFAGSLFCVGKLLQPCKYHT